MANIRMTVKFLSEKNASKEKMEQYALKEKKKCQPRILYPVTTSFKGHW